MENLSLDERVVARVKELVRYYMKLAKDDRRKMNQVLEEIQDNPPDLSLSIDGLKRYKDRFYSNKEKATVTVEVLGLEFFLSEKSMKEFFNGERKSVVIKKDNDPESEIIVPVEEE